jgi:transcriptional regulator with XRE-family HTH domain
MALGNRLKEARLLRGDSLRTVAHAVGMDPTHLSRVERGAGCSDTAKLALSRYFAIPLDRLFFREFVESVSTPEASS